MFIKIYQYLNKRRKFIATATGLTGGVYFLGKLIKWKFDEIKERTTIERTARENMRRRFQQRQIDCIDTVFAHLPSINESLLTEFDVESIISNLQRAKNSSSTSSSGSTAISTPTMSPGSSIVLIDRNDGSSSESSMNGGEEDSNRFLSAPNMNGHENNLEKEEHSDSNDGNSGFGDHEYHDSSSNPNFSSSEEPVTTNVINVQPSSSQLIFDRKTKIELWTEVKNKSFIRTIAAIYLETLFMLIIHINLNLLGRYNYICSVVSLAERDTEQLNRFSSESILSPIIIKKYLTFSWWFLNIGYREIVERVKSSVESVLSNISLKDELSYKDFVWIVTEIRSHVERNESDNQSAWYTNIMMPQNLEDEFKVLDKGGDNAFEVKIEPELRKLLDETKDFLDSQDFNIVQTTCLTTAFNLMQNHLYTDFIVQGGGSLDGEIIEKQRTNS
ncbi:9802_t:CDS:2 [Entrophospora sp. SA101]|nr:9802_t:CDS:2 [Entrophospora sp. SA101]